LQVLPFRPREDPEGLALFGDFGRLRAGGFVEDSPTIRNRQVKLE
jgi:hypothetical protein